MRILGFILFVSSLFALCIADVTVNPGELLLLNPVNSIVTSGEIVNLGAVGPGQTVFLVADSRVTTGGINGIGGNWDSMQVVNLPEGWKADPSLLYEQPMITRITVSPNAPDGQYKVVINAINNGDKEKIGGNVQFTALVNVSKNIMNVDIEPKVVVTGVSQPGSYTVTVRNNGVAADTFEITSTGIPLWSFTKTIYIGPNSEKTTTYEMVGTEEKEWNPTISVRFRSSDLMTHDETVKLIVNTNLVSDYKATAHGYLVFPIIEWPIYAMTGFLSNFF